jgi:hypothetical protein
MKLINKNLLALSFIGLSVLSCSASSNEETKARVESILDQKTKDIQDTYATLNELRNGKLGSSRKAALEYADSTIDMLNDWSDTLVDQELANYYDVQQLSRTLEAYHSALQQLQTPLQTSTGIFSGNSNQQRNGDIDLRLKELNRHVKTLQDLNRKAAATKQLGEIDLYIKRFPTSDTVTQSFNIDRRIQTKNLGDYEEYRSNPFLSDNQRTSLEKIVDWIYAQNRRYEDGVWEAKKFLAGKPLMTPEYRFYTDDDLAEVKEHISNPYMPVERKEELKEVLEEILEQQRKSSLARFQ